MTSTVKSVAQSRGTSAHKMICPWTPLETFVHLVKPCELLETLFVPLLSKFLVMILNKIL